jgi:hypothetical protein
MKIPKSLFILPFLSLTGCASITAENYANEQPTLDMVKYLTGHTTAWGLAQSRSGEVVRRFRIEMDGVPVGDNAVKVEEHDFFTDGKTEEHEWMFRNAGPHAVTATSDEVVGQATGEQYGNALNLHYTLKVRMSDGTEREFTISDWFYLQDDCRLINRTYASKFGFHAFDVMTFFEKDDCTAKSAER